jgi:serine/threonine-protein kinase
MDLIGEKLGRWRIERELGRGGMGRVFFAREEPGGDEPLWTHAAVKVLPAELAQEVGFAERFQREIGVLKQLDHPHIVRFFESGVDRGLSYYAMEYLPGQSFEDIVNERGPLTWKEVLDVALQVCPALKHAHDHGVIHRDIKPQNLLRGEDGAVKLTDFGIAKVFASRQLTMTGGLVGTAEYMAPEQAMGKPVTARSDLYSFGAVLYTLLTGRPPFEGETALELMHKHRYGLLTPPMKLVTEIPHDLDRIVCDLLAKEPGDRPPNALVLQRRFESFRGKTLRKDHATAVESGTGSTLDEARRPDLPADTPGTATIMSRLVRDELERQRRGGPVARFLNRPLVVIGLFAVCLGIILWSFLRPGQPAEEPDAPAPREVQNLYLQAARQYETGNRNAARDRWQCLIDAFEDSDDPAELSWVEKARKRLEAIPKSEAEPDRFTSARAALQRAKNYRDQGRRADADRIWNALENLYWNDPLARPLLSQIAQDRQLP